MSGKRFRYSLEALLRKRQSDWKTVKMEEATAGQVVDHKHAEVGETRGKVDGVEQLLRDARGDGMPIDTMRQHLLSNYLSHQRGVLVQRQKALDHAHQLHQRVKSNLEGIGRGIKSLEKHRAHRETDHRFAEGILEQNRLDEIWLLRGAKKSEAE